jgi:hypothetical protein
VARVTVAVPGRPYPVLVGLAALQELPRLVSVRWVLPREIGRVQVGVEVPADVVVGVVRELLS